MVVRDESEWSALLRSLDEPGERGQAAGLEFPRHFDSAATQRRFQQLAMRLGAVFGCPLSAGEGPQQDASQFGEIRIPPEFTVTRAKRSRIRFPVVVGVSNFGNLATWWLEQDGPAPAPPVHPDDRTRVEEALDGLGYLAVPPEVLQTSYDGPNQWVFDDRGGTWFVRYFGHL